MKACEDLFAGCPQLLVGELHQGHQVVRVLRNNKVENIVKTLHELNFLNVRQTS